MPSNLVTGNWLSYIMLGCGTYILTWENICGIEQGPLPWQANLWKCNLASMKAAHRGERIRCVPLLLGSLSPHSPFYPFPAQFCLLLASPNILYALVDPVCFSSGCKKVLEFLLALLQHVTLCAARVPSSASATSPEDWAVNIFVFWFVLLSVLNCSCTVNWVLAILEIAMIQVLFL